MTKLKVDAVGLRRPVLKFHSKVAIGNPFSKYCARMVSRSTATLNSLNGWPATELSVPRMSSLSRCSMPSTFRSLMKYCGPSSIWMKTAMSPTLPR